MKPMRIGAAGSMANPVTQAHREMLEALLNCGKFDRLIWIPSGERPEKPNAVHRRHRLAMTLLALPSVWYLHPQTDFYLDLDDVTHGINTHTIDYLRKLREENPGAEICWITGADSVVPKKVFQGRCEIEAQWKEGAELMRAWKFYIIPRAGYTHPYDLVLPTRFEILDTQLPDYSCTVVREAIAEGHVWEHMVDELVAEYIKRHKLYGYGTKK